MAKGSKQKLYEEPEDEQYIVITDPFGMPSSGSRQQCHVDETAAWLRCVFGTEDVPLAIFIMGTRKEIIASLDKTIDVIPSLGAHHWGTFAGMLQLRPGEADKQSCIYQYNYRIRGDPVSHNWQPKWPERVIKLPLAHPYPMPTWCEPTPSVSSLVLRSLQREPEQEPVKRTPSSPPQPALVCEDPRGTPIAPPATPAISNSRRTPATPPATSAPKDPLKTRTPVVSPAEPPRAVTPADLHAFTPYQPPSHYRPPLNPPENRPEIPKVKQEPSETLPPLVKKLDPYEEEDIALQLLRAPEPVKEEPQDHPIGISSSGFARVKPELDADRKILQPVDGYTPSAALLEAYRQLPQNSEYNAGFKRPKVEDEWNEGLSKKIKRETDY